MHTEHKSTSLPARLTLPVPSKAGGDKPLTVVTLGLRTQQRTPLLLLSAMGSTYIPLLFCSLSIFISSFLSVLMLQSAS